MISEECIIFGKPKMDPFDKADIRFRNKVWEYLRAGDFKRYEEGTRKIRVGISPDSLLWLFCAQHIRDFIEYHKIYNKKNKSNLPACEHDVIDFTADQLIKISRLLLRNSDGTRSCQAMNSDNQYCCQRWATVKWDGYEYCDSCFQKVIKRERFSPRRPENFRSAAFSYLIQCDDGELIQWALKTYDTLERIIHWPLTESYQNYMGLKSKISSLFNSFPKRHDSLRWEKSELRQGFFL